MNDDEIRTTILEAKAAEAAELEAVKAAHSAMAAIVDRYRAIGTRRAIGITTHARRAMDAIAETLERLS